MAVGDFSVARGEDIYHSPWGAYHDLSSPFEIRELTGDASTSVDTD